MFNIFNKPQEYKKQFECRKCGDIITADYDLDKPIEESTAMILGFHINRHGISKEEIVKLFKPYCNITEDIKYLRLSCNFCNQILSIKKNHIGVLNISGIINHISTHLAVIDQCDMAERFVLTYFKLQEIT